MMASTSNAPGPANELNFKGFKVFVETKNEAGVWNKAEVFKVESPHVKKITCYIASETGLQYRICAANNNLQRPDFIYLYYADGTKLVSRVIRSAHKQGHTSVCKGESREHNTVHPIYFAKLTTTDDDQVACQNEEVVRNLGTISVRILRTMVHLHTKRVHHSHASGNQTLPLPMPLVHEQNKKAQVGHSTTFGAGVEVARRKTYKTTEIDSDNDPFLFFEFKYRSRSLLEAQGVISLAEASANANAASLDTSIPTMRNPKSRPSGKGKIIDIDESGEESEIDKLRREVAELRKTITENSSLAKTKVKTEAAADIKPDLKRKAASSYQPDGGNSSNNSIHVYDGSEGKKKKIKKEPGQIIDLTLD